jgi:hypothetical protein
MAKLHLPNHDPFKEVSCETEYPSPPSLELEPCPSGYPNIILEKENFSAMDVLEAPTYCGE